MTAPYTLERYRAVLATALDAGYRFALFGEIDRVRTGDGPACLLRHDCDNSLVAARRMAEVEATTGIRSTWFVMLRSALYNLMAPTTARLVREILAMGHGLGLHFDESVHVRDPLEVVAERVERERRWLEGEFGVAVEAVSFHQPSRRILDNRVQLACLNAYDRTDMRAFHYISDSNMVWKEACPSVLFAERRYRLLQLLIHPEWWTPEPLSVAAKWHLMLADNLGQMQDSLVEREAIFEERFRMSLAPPPASPEGNV